MDPIKNVGANDYVRSMQPQQNQLEENYASMPMVYDPEVEEKKNAASNMIGLGIMGAIALGGLAYGAVKRHQTGKLDAKIKDLTAEKETIQKKLTDITTEKETMQKELTDVKNRLSEIENKQPEKKTFWQKLKDLFRKDKKEKTEVKPAEGETKPKEPTKSENTEEAT